MKIKGGIPLFVWMTVLVLLCSQDVARAQEKKEPPPRPMDVERKDDAASREAKLPKISLPEFVITGREVIELPPTSKLYGDTSALSPDPSRFTALGEKGGDGLRDASAKSSANRAQDLKTYDAKLSVGYGRFKSPYGEGWFGKKFQEGDFSLHGRYISHSAYIPHANAAEGELNASGGIYLPERLVFLGGSKLSGNVAYEGKKHRFFGSTDPALERMVRNYQVGTAIVSGPRTRVRYEGSVQFRRLTLEDRGKSSEDNLTLALQASGDVSGARLRGEFYYAADFLDQPNSTRDPHYLRTSAGLQKLFFEDLHVALGAGLYIYRNSSTKFVSKVYPSVALQYALGNQWAVFTQFNPTVEQNSLLRATTENRYIGKDVYINHQDIFLNLSAGVQFAMPRRGSGRLYVKYERIRDFPIYIDPSTLYYIAVVPTPYRDWDVTYLGTTRFVSLNGDLLWDITKADRLSGKVTILWTHNSETGKRIPYMAPFQLASTYTHQFPFGLSTEIIGRFVGRRSIDLGDSWKLSSFFLLAARGEFRVIENLSVFLHLNNILDEQYSIWNLYREIPFSLRGGISVRW